MRSGHTLIHATPVITTRQYAIAAVTQFLSPPLFSNTTEVPALPIPIYFSILAADTSFDFIYTNYYRHHLISRRQR
jgi:hypothetical protein